MARIVDPPYSPAGPYGYGNVAHQLYTLFFAPKHCRTCGAPLAQRVEVFRRGDYSERDGQPLYDVVHRWECPAHVQRRELPWYRRCRTEEHCHWWRARVLSADDAAREVRA